MSIFIWNYYILGLVYQFPKYQEGDIFKIYPTKEALYGFSDNAAYNLTFTFLIIAYRRKKKSAGS